jgi:predicted TPR repeat methyltransferase
MAKTKIDIAAIKKLHQAGNLEEARHGYLLLLKHDPKNAEAYHSLAIIATQEDKADEAMEYIQKAIHLQPKNPVLYLHLANIYKAQGFLDQSIEVLNQIITLDPNCISAYNNLGIMYYAQGKFPEAIKAYQTALEKQPDYVDAHYNLGLALIKNQELVAAIELYENLLKNAPKHFAARFHLACTLMKQEKLALAEQHFLIIQETHPYHFETQSNLATCFLKQGALTEAKKHYISALDISPQDTQILFNLGVINTQLGEIDSAIQAYQRAIETNPDYFEAHNNLGAIFIMKQNAGLALHHFKEALRLQPDNKAIRYTVDVLSKNQLLLAAPSDYITTLFDAYADHYDAHLVKALDYKVPELLYQAVTAVTPTPLNPTWDILDLGCGTGLSAAPFKTIAKKLIGVDLSTKMLAEAKQKNLYNELITQDLVTFLSDKHSEYNLVLAGDVFVYMGDLDKIFSEVSTALKKDGLFAFNAEINSREGFTTNQSGRFLHHQLYLDNLAEQYHFKIAYYKNVITRMQNNTPVYGHVYILKK